LSKTTKNVWKNSCVRLRTKPGTDQILAKNFTATKKLFGYFNLLLLVVVVLLLLLCKL
jgi:hypothetical protein